MYLLTLTVPEQAQGASKVSELSNSSSWHILQRGIAESNFKSSTNKTTSAIYFTPNDFSHSVSSNFSLCFQIMMLGTLFFFSFLFLSLLRNQQFIDLYMKEKTNRIPKLPLFDFFFLIFLLIDLISKEPNHEG